MQPLAFRSALSKGRVFQLAKRYGNLSVFPQISALQLKKGRVRDGVFDCVFDIGKRQHGSHNSKNVSLYYTNYIKTAPAKQRIPFLKTSVLKTLPAFFRIVKRTENCPT